MGATMVALSGCRVGMDFSLVRWGAHSGLLHEFVHGQAIPGLGVVLFSDLSAIPLPISVSAALG